MLSNVFLLTKRKCLSIKEEKKRMQKVPYVSTIKSLMYLMVCARADIAYAVGPVSCFLLNPGKEH